MKRVLRAVLPKRIGSQLAVLVVVAVLVLHAVVSVLFYIDRLHRAANGPAEVTGRISTIAASLDATPASAREAQLARWRGLYPQLALHLDAASAPRPAAREDSGNFHLARALPPPLALLAATTSRAPSRASRPTPPGAPCPCASGLPRTEPNP